MLQIILTLVIFVLLIIPIGRYMFHIATGQHTFCDPVFNRIDNGIYRICGINQNEGMGWKKYALALVLTNAVMVFIGYLILRIQFLPVFNPNGIGAMEPTLSFNTIISFMTNTNLQHYSGESGLSYLSQMLVIIFMMFVSASTGYAACVAFCRGLTGTSKNNLGNFYVDLVRITTRILIPFSIIVTLILVWQGAPQNFMANQTVTTIEGTKQDIAMGPIASLVSIKHLGTNGGGFLGANSTTPLENPTIISDITELLSMMILPGACVIMFGLMYHNRKKLTDEAHPVVGRRLTDRQPIFGGEGRTVFVAMGIIFVVGLCLCYFSELAGNPKLAEIGLSQSMGSMEGKEVRFGIAQSALFTTVTTSFTTGTVNNMHDTLTPLGGMVPLLHMMLNCVFGGKGVGLMNMIMYVMLGVFLCGLMIGRTPEYLGKKVEGREMKMAVLVLIIHPLLILGFSALAVGTEAGRAGITNPGFHGLSQVLYEYSSSAANNGSGFEGLADNTYFWNITAGLAMFLFVAMGIIFVVGLCLCYFSELAGNPKLAEIGLSQSMGSMEGKEVRFGIAQSALFTTVTTSFTTGTVNNMHDTLTPLGGMVPLLHMMLNCVFGGKGVGLMNMIMYVMLGVFLCGLMIGRTPEYLGKKVEGREMKMAVLVLIIHPLLILGFSALAVGTEAGRAGITNPGFHGLSQVLYEYSSSAANNGSGFEGLADNTYFWNITAGLAMFFGRYLAIVLQLAIAWSLLCKKRMNESIGTLKTNNIGFGVIVAFVVYIFAALTFFPALALGPIAEHLSIWLPV